MKQRTYKFEAKLAKISPLEVGEIEIVNFEVIAIVGRGKVMWEKAIAWILLQGLADRLIGLRRVG